MPTKIFLLPVVLALFPMGILYTQAQRPPAQNQQRQQPLRRPAQGQAPPAQRQRVPARVQQRPPAQNQQRQQPLRRPAQRPAKIEHRWGMNIAFLMQNSPFREFSFYTNNTWYAQGYRAWTAGNVGLGLSFGFSYDVTFPGGGLFRTQLQLETTGWFFGMLDIGGGVRIPIKNGISASVEGYFSTGLSGGSLARLANHQDRQPLSVFLFGLKARGSVEFPIKKNWYSSIYISYAAYPWHAANKKPLYINGIGAGAIIDSLQVGVEFGQKF